MSPRRWSSAASSWHTRCASTGRTAMRSRRRLFATRFSTLPSSSLRFWSTIIFSLVLLAGCDSRPQFKSTDITGADYGKSLELTDHTGRPRKLEDWRGQVVGGVLGVFTYTPHRPTP